VSEGEERWRRWRLALGDPESHEGLGDRDQRLDRALSALYETSEQKAGRKGGLGASSPRVARWLGDIREFFPKPVVQVIQKDAFERLGLKRLLLEPEFSSRRTFISSPTLSACARQCRKIPRPRRVGWWRRSCAS
jgi:hypothetical protein